MSAKYAIIEFVKTREVHALPTSWFVNDEEDRCYYPRMLASNREKLIKDQAVPKENWPQYVVRVLGRAGITSNMSVALKFCI
jgi:hypothetical protein